MANKVLTSTKIIELASSLQKDWSARNAKFKDWYSQIQMVDRLAQANMESFVGNDPRAAFNLLTSILDQTVPHRIPPDILTMEQMRPASELSRLYDVAWGDIHDQARRKGHYWMRDLVGFVLATGWYSVFSVISVDGSTCIAEVWNPATVFPRWDDTLTECAHIFSISESRARRLGARNKWALPVNLPSGLALYDYWWIDETEQVNNAIVLGDKLVKPATVETRFNRIPIFVAPIGGMPDSGEISGDATAWRGEIGQSFVATNENVYKAFDKWWTFMLQILRDTAQPRTFEKTRGAKQIVKPEDWNKRGAHYKMAPEDEIGFVQQPVIPVELRSTQLDMEAMMQRGGPSWAMYGNVQQQMTAYVMSQVVASTNQTCKAYHRAVVDCLTDIDNFWLYLMINQKYKPYGLQLPRDLPVNAKVSAEYELRIPGDLSTRATIARMLNPTFELSDEQVMSELFPEIKNPVEELARVRAAKARQNPIYAQISLIEALKQEALLLRNAKDTEGATLYEKASARLEQQLIGEQVAPAQGGRTPRAAAPVRPRPEVVPPPGTPPVVGQEGA